MKTYTAINTTHNKTYSFVAKNLSAAKSLATKLDPAIYANGDIKLFRDSNLKDVNLAASKINGRWYNALKVSSPFTNSIFVRSTSLDNYQLFHLCGDVVTQLNEDFPRIYDAVTNECCYMENPNGLVISKSDVLKYNIEIEE